MANMKLILALFASLFVANTMAISHQEATDVLERRAEALELRAEQLQDLAEVYRRALDDELELVERGTPTVNVHCANVPWKACTKAKTKVQKMYAGDKALHKFKNGEIFLPNPLPRGSQVVKHVAVAFYNEARRPISAPSVNVAL